MCVMAQAAVETLPTKAREVLANPSHDGLALIIDHLYCSKESEEYKSARALYDFCVSDFPNCLTMKLLKIYRYSTVDNLRLRLIYHLSETLNEFRNRSFKLSLVALGEIKPLLISCLKVPNPRSGAGFLRMIVSFVADNIVISDSTGWEELSEFMLSLTHQNPIKAFDFFIDLPKLYEEFFNLFLQPFREQVYKVLLHPKEDSSEDWVLAMKAAFKMVIQLIDSEGRYDLTRDILQIVLKAATEVVRMGMEKEFLGRGLQSLQKFLEKEAKLYTWSTQQCGFVAEFAFGIRGIGKKTKEAANKIFEMVTKMDNYVHNPAFKLTSSCVDNGVQYDLELYNHFWNCTPLEILNLFAVPKSDCRYREIAIRRLHHILSDHTSQVWEIDYGEIIDLQPLLIKSLKEKGMPENLYRILGKVVFHVAMELFNNGMDPWPELWDYIASENKSEFNKAVYIFQSLTMKLDFSKDLVVRAITKLVPEIRRRLTPPREVLVDNCNWVLAFTGAYCSVIHLLHIKSHAKYVKEIALKMIDSVKELVERRMETGLVRRAFRDLERIIFDHLDWFLSCEYRFVKGLIWRLHAIKGMKMESKFVLWRINVEIERSVDEEDKLIPKNEFDWLNQPDEPLAN